MHAKIMYARDEVKQEIVKKSNRLVLKYLPC